MYQNPKSATTAGLLGIFLGSFGAHNWYLGEKGKGIAHVCMMSGGILLEIITGAILPNVLSFSMLLNLAWLLAILTPIALAAMTASGIWGLVEGIIIISQGDAGLARKGYAVADPMMAQGYGQPMNNMNGMNNMGGMNNGMNGMNGVNNMGNGNMNGNMNGGNNMGNGGGNMNNGMNGMGNGMNNGGNNGGMNSNNGMNNNDGQGNNNDNGGGNNGQ